MTEEKLSALAKLVVIIASDYLATCEANAKKLELEAHRARDAVQSFSGAPLGHEGALEAQRNATERARQSAAGWARVDELRALLSVIAQP